MKSSFKFFLVSLMCLVAAGCVVVMPARQQMMYTQPTVRVAQLAPAGRFYKVCPRGTEPVQNVGPDWPPYCMGVAGHPPGTPNCPNLAWYILPNGQKYAVCAS